MEFSIKEEVAELSDDEKKDKAEPIHKLRRLSKLATDLKKQVQELNTNQQPSMPPKVVQQRKESTNQVVSRLREAEKICTEEVEAIFAIWEKLIDDETIE